MTAGVLQNITRSTRVAEQVHVPASPWAWALGLLVREPLRQGEALWLRGCGSVHTWGLRQPIDVVFLNRDMRVLRVVRGLRPWRAAFAPRGTAGVMEFAGGGAESVRTGDLLALDPPC